MSTTIQVDDETRDKLKKFGHKGETYDQIINRLMEYFKELNMENMIKARYERLQEEKNEYEDLEEI